jgi:hypothetical protein
VIVVGDLNDILTDSSDDNVFQIIIDDTVNYKFTDMQIALGNPTDFSYPSWPSHLDHILITNELFADFSKPNSIVSCIRIDDYMSSWNAYDNNISDHRPVGLKLEVDAVISATHELEISEIKLIKAVDLLGKEVRKNAKGILFYMYSNGSVAKRVVVE